HDLALKNLYPLASLTADDDAADLVDDATFRWGGMGHDGAQAVDAAKVTLQAAHTPYHFAASRFTNIDSSAIVIKGAPPFGAHRTFARPGLGWASPAAAGVGGAAGVPGGAPAPPRGAGFRRSGIPAAPVAQVVARNRASSSRVGAVAGPRLVTASAAAAFAL